MALAKSSGLFGIRDAKIYELLTDIAGAAPTYDVGVDVPGIKSLGMDKKVDSKDSRGDEMLLDTEDTLTQIDVSWENAELPMTVCSIIENSTLTTSGTAETEKHVLTEAGGSSGNYFKISGLAKRGSNGVADVQVDLFKVKGSLTYSFKGEDFAVCSFKGRAIPIQGTISTIANPIRQLTYSAAAITLA